MQVPDDPDWSSGLGRMVFDDPLPATAATADEYAPLQPKPGGKVHSGDARWRSVFSADRKRRMNGIPILLNVLLPWLLFCVAFYFWSFRFHFRYGTKLKFVLLGLGAVCFVPLYLWWDMRKTNRDPSWFGYTTLTFVIAVACGCALGDENYANNMWYYYKYDSMEAYPLVDVGKELGVNMLDAGRVYFSSDSHIEQKTSWHFKDGTVYCVAPIMTSNMLTETLDFWAVGTDCCGTSAPDFRCGEFANPRARSGLRVLDEAILPNYRLAVEQASALFHLHSTNPIFFIWTQDPLEDVMKYRQAGWNFFTLSVLGSLLLTSCLTFAAAVRFSFIGREPVKDDSAA